MKEKIANVLKTILRVCIRIVVAIALIAFLVVPFLSNKIDHSIAQRIWYPAVSIYSIFAIIGCFNNEKQTFQDKLLDFVGKLGSILIIPVVVSIFVFNYYEINHIWLWVIFVMVLVFIPGALVMFLKFEIKHNNRTKEEIGIAAKNIIKYTFLFLLYDFTYMAIFNNWLFLTYIFGILSVAIILVGLARTFISGNKSLQFMLYIDLIIGVGLSIYLIYIIPDKFANLQTIVTTIVAAIYGGLLTLVGVAWTIKQNNEDKREEERKKHVPYLILTLRRKEDKNDYVNGGFLNVQTDNAVGEFEHYFSDFIVKNISKSIIILESIVIESKKFCFERKEILAPNQIVGIRINRADPEEKEQTKYYSDSRQLNSIKLIVCDCLENRYEIVCGLEVYIGSTYTIKEISLPKLM